MNSYSGMNMGMGWGMGFGWLLGVIVLAIFIWLVVKVISQNSKGASNHKSALNILKSRYANDEIDKKEYEEKKKDLL